MTQDRDDITTDLQAVIIYLRTIGAVYPVAPQMAIDTIERAIEYINIKEQPHDTKSMAR